MGDILTAISNFLSASWRAGAALFLVGASVHLSKVYGIPPLSELDPQWNQGAILAGVLGLALLVVHGLALLGQGIGFTVPRLYRLMMAPIIRRREQRLTEERAEREQKLAVEKTEQERELALKNWDTISTQDFKCLIWIKHSNQQRFKASRANPDLNRLYDAHLLNHDLSERNEYASEIHWVVPDVIWTKLDAINLKKLSFHLGKDPPWERSYYA